MPFIKWYLLVSYTVTAQFIIKCFRNIASFTRFIWSCMLLWKLQQIYFAYFRFTGHHFSFQLSADVGQCSQYGQWIGRGRKCGCSHQSFSVILIQSWNIAYFRFTGRHFYFLLSTDVGQCWQYCQWIEHGKKYGCSHRNFSDISIQFWDIAQFRFACRDFDFRLLTDVGQCWQYDVVERAWSKM